jgi:CDP-4-dehydro-6-deoxyglucose reductase, E1
MNLFNKNLIKKNYKYKLLDNGISKDDISKAKNVLDSKQITMASQTRKFEEIFAKTMGVKHALMVNSGSSANLLSIFAAGNPLRKNRLKKGDEVIIPVLCWSTSLWPIVQFGLKPVFIDIDPNTLNVNEDDLIKKINPKTKCIFLVNVHGNSCDLFKIKKIAKKKNIILIEDNCESLGSKLKNKKLGSFGDFGTFSFFYSHQITSGEGGMVVCNNDNDYEILFALRSHGWLGGTRFYPRRLKSYNYYAKKYPKLDPRYIFVNSGFNLRPTDIQASIGLNQFKRLNKLISNRNLNRKLIIDTIKKDKRWKNQFSFIEPAKNISPSWMGLPIIINKKYKNKKMNFLNYLDKKGIETRPIISGAFTNQPATKLYNLNPNKRTFYNAQFVQELGFLIGLHQKKISSKNLNLIKNSFLNIENI